MNKQPQSPLQELTPRLLWSFFDELRRIPRQSLQEALVREWIIEKAKLYGWLSSTDSGGNLVCYVPGRGNGVKASALVLQAHMDMVCVAADGSKHDFQRDPIEVQITEASINGNSRKVVKARGTTLGADNGIGVAALLAAAVAEEVKDAPPLELVFTSAEEIGLVGAGKFQMELLKGRNLINCDSFDSDGICVGSGASSAIHVRWEVKRAPAAAGLTPFRIRIGGLPGGHSGSDIHEDRPNAIRLLLEILTDPSFALHPALINGGIRDNAIPSSAEALVWAQPNLDDSAILARPYLKAIRSRHACLTLNVEAWHEAVPHPFISEQSTKIVEGLRHLPHGVLAMSSAMPDLVESSNCFSLISTDEGAVKAECKPRSSAPGFLEKFQKEVQAEISKFGGVVSYPTEAHGLWPVDLQSPLLATAAHVYRRVNGVEPRICATHAGLECALFVAGLPGMKAICIGPDIKNAHSPEEYVVIPSVEKFWRLLVGLVTEMAGNR